MFQTDTANLMLWDEFNNTVWQSFDHPTNMLLPNQIMLPGGNPVYASQDASSQVEGIGTYSLRVGEAGLVLYVNLDVHEPLAYWTFGFYGSNYTSSILNSCNLPIYVEFFAYLPHSLEYVGVLKQSKAFTSNATRTCNSSRNWTALPAQGLFEINQKWTGGAGRKLALKLEYDGRLNLYSWNTADTAVTSPTTYTLFGDDQPCSLPKLCRQFGVCNPMSATQCSCPSSTNASESFTPRVASDLSQGCSAPGVYLSCANSTNQYLVRLSGIDYFPNNFLEPLKMTIDRCADLCLSNCTCYGAFYRINSGGCFHIFQPLMTLTNQSNSSYVAFIKLQKSSDLGANSSRTAKVSSAAKKWAGIISAPVAIVVLLTLSGTLWWRKSGNKLRQTEEEIFLDTLPGLPPRFQFKQLEVATERFSHKLGQGAFGVVYKGTLPDGTEVAVKKLEGDNVDHGQLKQFRAEVATIGRIHHFNLVRLCGFCVEGSYRILVYEFMENGSLDCLLFSTNVSEEGGNPISLDWLTRLNIAISTARGLAYLHEDCREKILHLDIKPQNILLDKNFVAKVADFGLAKLTKRDQSLVMTQMRGTPGYLAPEWLLLGAVTEKADVYSYGMVLLELISGRCNVDRSLDTDRWFYPAWASQKYSVGEIMELVDTRLQCSSGPSTNEVQKVLQIAFWCIQEDETIRPPMGFVVQMLEGHVEVPEPPIDFHFLQRTEKRVANIMSSSLNESTQQHQPKSTSKQRSMEGAQWNSQPHMLPRQQ